MLKYRLQVVTNDQIEIIFSRTVCQILTDYNFLSISISEKKIDEEEEKAKSKDEL